jgi:hypothetical protein
MLPSKSPAEPLDSHAVVPVRQVMRGGDTDALDWRSDAHLLAILERAAQREQEDREKDLITVP